MHDHEAALGGYRRDAEQAGSDQGQQETTAQDSQSAESADGQTPSITDDIRSDDLTGSGSSLADIANRYKTSSEGVPEFGDVFFDYDSYGIGMEGRRIIDDLSVWLVNNNAIMLVEGHCDERGTREYNIALGDRRALSVKDYLLAGGVPDLKIETVSYGKERPQCREADESCWSRNRRAHFVIEVVR